MPCYRDCRYNERAGPARRGPGWSRSAVRTHRALCRGMRRARDARAFGVVLAACGHGADPMLLEPLGIGRDLLESRVRRGWEPEARRRAQVQAFGRARQH